MPLRFVFNHNIKDKTETFVKICWQLVENTDSDFKGHALHYANDYLYASVFPFKNFRKLSAQTCRNNTQKNVWEKSYDVYSLSIRVQTTINHISICFLPQYQRQRKWFLSRAWAEKGIAWHIDTSSVVWLGRSNFWLVRSEHVHASYPGLFFRPPGFSPYVGREERRVQGLD